MDKKQQVCQWLQEHQGELQELLTALIRIPSVMGEEYAVQQLVAETAERFGLEVECRAFDEEQKRPCVLVTYRGNGSGKRLMLDAHSDTVPVPDPENWAHDPFGGEFDGEWIHGRGAADDKWGIAAGLMTLRALKECGVTLAGDVLLLSSVGEEIGVNGRLEVGAGAMVASMEKKPDFCIVCEESGNSVGTEAPANLKFSVKVKGKAAHSCSRRNCVYPQNQGVLSGSAMGVDALQKVLPVLDAFYRLERDLSVNHSRGGLIGSGGAPDAPRSSVGAVTINPVKIEGGGTNSLIPLVTVDYNMHYSPTYSKEEMLELLQDTLYGVSRTDLWLRENPPVLELFSHTNGFCCDPSEQGVALLLDAHRAVFGTPTRANSWPAGCDADVVEAYCPAVVYGPSGAFAHGPNERGHLGRMMETAKVYALTAMEFCK